MLSNPEIRAIVFYIILCCKGGHQSFLAAGKRRFLFFFISIPVMYRIYNVSSEKILIQFINLLQIEALDYKSCTLLSHDWGGALAW